MSSKHTLLLIFLGIFIFSSFLTQTRCAYLKYFSANEQSLLGHPRPVRQGSLLIPRPAFQGNSPQPRPARQGSLPIPRPAFQSGSSGTRLPGSGQCKRPAQKSKQSSKP